MAACIAGFLACRFGPPVIATQAALLQGVGWRPWQWVTRHFVHLEPVHLVVNLTFLWAFGVIVEGKIGWGRMLGLCTLLGVCQAALEQTCTFWFPSGSSHGISAVAAGLMAAAVLWAPVNVFQFPSSSCLFRTLVPPDPWEFPIWGVAALFLGVDLATTVWTGFAPNTAPRHLLGALLGGLAAAWMLHSRQVDCGGWDLFSIWRRRERLNESAAARAVGISLTTAIPDTVSSDLFLARRRIVIRRCLSERQTELAWQGLHHARHLVPDFSLPAEDVIELADQLRRLDRPADEAALLSDFLSRQVRVYLRPPLPLALRLAELLLDQRLAHQALQVLDTVAVENDRVAELWSRHRDLQSVARRLIQQGNLEPVSFVELPPPSAAG